MYLRESCTKKYGFRNSAFQGWLYLSSYILENVKSRMEIMPVKESCI